MGLDRRERDVKFVGDFGVGPTTSHGDQHLLFPVGQRFNGLHRFRSARRLGEGFQQPDRDAGGDEGVTGGCGVNGLHQQLGAGVF